MPRLSFAETEADREESQKAMKRKAKGKLQKAKGKSEEPPYNLKHLHGGLVFSATPAISLNVTFALLAGLLISKRPKSE